MLLVLLLTLASVGIGMLISALSTSDSQAIQLTMLVLLLSIFFTGFFLPLKGFTPFAWPISAVLPLTHGLQGLQDLMLIGRTAPWQVWAGLGSITLATYGLVVAVTGRLYRKVV